MTQINISKEEMAELAELFDPTTQEDVNNEIARTAGKYLDVSSVGSYRIRVLPAQKGSVVKVPWTAIHKHWLRLPNDDYEVAGCSRTAVDPRYRGPCFCCALQKHLRDKGNDLDAKLADSIEGRLSGMAEVIDRNAESAGVRIWRFGVTVLNQLSTLMKDKERCGYDFSNPVYGIDLIITVTKQPGNKNNNYVVTPADRVGRGPIARLADGKPDIPKIKEWLASRPGLESELGFEPYEAVRDKWLAALRGQKVKTSNNFVADPSKFAGTLGGAEALGPAPSEGANGTNGANGASEPDDGFSGDFGGDFGDVPPPADAPNAGDFSGMAGDDDLPF